MRGVRYVLCMLLFFCMYSCLVYVIGVLFIRVGTYLFQYFFSSLVRPFYMYVFLSVSLT